MSDDDFGVFGSGAASDDDDYGVWGATRPKRKRTRSKRVPAARDVEAPTSPEAVDTAPEEETSEDAEDMRRGPPPGPAGAPTSEGQRGGALRTEEPAWYEPLLDSALSFYKGATLNTLDEQAAGLSWMSDKVGLTNTGRSYDENRALLDKRITRAAETYPYAEGAGTAATAMTTSLAAPAGKLAQTAVGGAVGGIDAYARNRDPLGTVIGTGIGAGSALLGAYGAEKAAKWWPKSRVGQTLAELEEAAGDPRAGRSVPQYDPLAAQTGAAVPETPRPLPAETGPAYDPLAAQTGAKAPEVVPREVPRPLPVEPYPGGYDPLAAQTMATPVGPPRPQPVPAATGPRVPEGRVPTVLRGAGGKFQKVLPMELDMTPAPGRAQPLAPEGPQFDDAWAFDLPPDAPIDAAPRPRVGGVPPEPGPPQDEVLSYLLGEVPAPKNAAPMPRLGGPPEAAPGYQLGEFVAPSSAAPSPRVGGFGSEPAPERVLRDAALREAAQEMPKGLLGQIFGEVATQTPGATGKVLRTANAARKLAGDARAREFAVQTGKLVPDYGKGGAWMVGNRVAYGMSDIPETLSDYGGKGKARLREMLTSADPLASRALAQDAEPVAYADQATMNYALSETLSSGQTGLSPQDEQTLTSAVVRGDDDAIRAADFRMRQKYPAYARKVERALRGLNEED